MSSKITCSSCGHSWNKSDSSKKDMYVCHICGKDNTMKNGGWLNKYGNGGTMQEYQENYNDSTVSYPEGFVGEGYNTKGRNYSPAWGGQFAVGGSLPGAAGHFYARYQNGGNINIPTIKDEGSFNEDGIWIPDWKAMAEQAKKLGAKKVKTEQGGVIYFNDKWEVVGAEDGNSMAMGGSVPGDVGFEYPRTKDIPNNGKYAKKTLPSAQNGGWLEKYENGGKAKNGEPTSKPISAADKKIIGQFINNLPVKKSIPIVPPTREPVATESTANRFYNPITSQIVSTANNAQDPNTIKALSAAALKETQDRKKRVAERKSAVATKDKGTSFTLPDGKTKNYKDMTAGEKSYVDGKALENRGRFDEDDENIFDELNPLNLIGNLAGNYGRATYEAEKTGSFKPFLGAIGQNLLEGALGFSPLDAAMKVPGKIAQSMESGLLSNTYKINPLAFKTNPEAYYRVIGKSGYDDAINNNVIRPKINSSHSVDYPTFKKGVPLDGRYGESSVKGLIGDNSYMVESTGNKMVQNRWTANAPDSNVFLPRRKLTADNEGVKFYKKDWLKGYEEVPKPNPNIYKAIVPGVIGLGAASQIEQKKNGGIVKDDMGYWNPENWGKPVEIDSNIITMQGVNQPLIGVSDTGDIQYMEPGEDEYVFDGNSVVEYPVAKFGKNVPKAQLGLSTKKLSAEEKLAIYQKGQEMVKDAQSMGRKDWENKFKDVLNDQAKLDVLGGFSAYKDFKNNEGYYDSRINSVKSTINRQVANQQLSEKAMGPSSYIKNYLNNYNSLEEIKKNAATKYGYLPGQEIDPVKFVSNNMVKEANERIKTNKGFPLYQDPENEMTCINGVCTIAADQGVDFSGLPHGEGTGVRQDAQGRWIPQFNPTFSQNYQKAGYRLLDVNEAPAEGDIAQYYNENVPKHAELVLSADNKKINTFNNYDLTGGGSGFSTRNFDPSQEPYNTERWTDTRYYRLIPEAAEKAAMKNPAYTNLLEGKTKFESSEENKKYQELNKSIENIDASILGEDAGLFNEIVSGARGKYAKDKPGLFKSLSGKSKNPELLERIINQSYKNGGQLIKLDQLTNFTNYNKPQPGGWLNKYN